MKEEDAVGKEGEGRHHFGKSRRLETCSVHEHNDIYRFKCKLNLLADPYIKTWMLKNESVLPHEGPRKYRREIVDTRNIVLAFVVRNYFYLP